ncbi:MAG TPA: helix-turn-helix domain-containing protein [Prolixibacteraceae bacterium]
MKNVGLIIPHDYKLLSIAAILDVFETVNSIYAESHRELPIGINIIQTPEQIEKNCDSFHGYPVKSITSGFVADIVLIPSFTTANIKDTIAKNQRYIPWIQQQYGAGAEIASFCTGAFLFGATGLLNGKLATTHVDACNALASSFPLVLVKPDQTVTADGRCYTSGGSTSTFHLLILLVQKYCGNDVAIRIAKIFAIDLDRYTQSYFSTFRPNYTHNDDLVMRVQREIETNYVDINTIDDVIKDLPASRRNIVRRFKKVTGIPPIEYLQHIRIETAKRQLEQTNHTISEIISDTGYTDPKSFRKTFHKLVGMKPVEYRDKFKVK